MKVSLAIVVLALIGVAPAPIHSSGRFGDDTRALLQKAADPHETRALARLVRNAESRAESLVRALDDPDTSVCVTAQRVIEYSQNEVLRQQLSAWRERVGRATGRVVTPGLDRPASPVFLECTKRALPKEVLRRLHPDQGASIRVMAENRASGSIVLRVTYGDVKGNAFTSGYDVVARQRGRGWDVVINTLRWES